MAVKNSTILYKMMVSGNNDYMLRLPDPSQATMAETVEKIFAPMNGRIYNAFCDELVQRIGTTIMRSKQWDNPLAVFKGGKMNYGSTIQEIAPKWLIAHSYDDAAQTLLQVNRPEVQAAYHSINRQDRYDLTINRDELRQAFAEEYGLNSFIDGVLSVSMNSDNYDEFRAMMQLIGIYEDKWGFFKDQKAFPVDQDTAQAFLQAIRAYAGRLTFPSTIYNAGVVDVPCFAKPDELVLLIQPDALAAIDVRALAAAFNRSDADFNIGRIVLVDEFPVPDIFAILTTEDFFVCNDVEYTTASFYNPQTLSTNYYLHHWEILSVSPFVPAIAFTTDTGTTIPTRTYAATTFDVTAGDVIDGNKIQLEVALSGTIDGDAGDVPPISAATWQITDAYTVENGTVPTPDPVPVALNSRTYVDRNNVLHLQKSGWHKGEPITTLNYITLKATSTYANPSGDTATLEDTITISFTVADDGTIELAS